MTGRRLPLVPLAVGLSVLAAACGGGSAKSAAVQASPSTLAPVETAAVPAATAAPSAPAAAASDPATAELSSVDAELGLLEGSIAAVDQARSQGDG